MAVTPEGRVKDAAKKFFGEIGAYYYMPVSNGMGRVGAPDFIVCTPITITADMVGQTVGLFCGFEAKAPGNIKGATANQLREIAAIQAAGGEACVFDDVEQLRAALSLRPLRAYL